MPHGVRDGVDAAWHSGGNQYAVWHCGENQCVAMFYPPTFIQPDEGFLSKGFCYTTVAEAVIQIILILNEGEFVTVEHRRCEPHRAVCTRL